MNVTHKVVNIVRDRLLDVHQTAAFGRLPGVICTLMTDCLVIGRKLEECRTLGLHRAATRLGALLDTKQNQLRVELAAVPRTIPARPPVPSMRDIVNELHQVETEFGSWSYQGHCLTVATDPIELEGVGLGPFEIRLDLSQMGLDGEWGTYRVVALDPNPAASDFGVTHPHVNGERLCAGDALGPVRQALSTGRLCDFFLIVKSVLNTYNPHSPFVKLEAWAGVSCYECGWTMSSDDSYYCEGCCHDYCSDCASYCASCDQTMCRGCLRCCAGCDDYTCASCLKSCKECQDEFCEGCLEDGLCETCRKEMEDERAKEEERAEATIAA